MFIVYILKNSVTGRYYIGCTNNIDRRLSEHNRHHSKSTSTKGRWIAIYKESHTTNLEARKRERQIKSYKGGNGFKKLIAAVIQW